MRIHFNTDGGGDWVDCYVDGKHFFGNHSMNWRDLVPLLKELGSVVTRTELSDEEMEDECRSPEWNVDLYKEIL